jgi:sortase A
MDTIFGTNEPRNKILRWGEYVLLTAGFICLGWVGYSYLETYVYQGYESYSLDQMLKGKQPTMSGYVGSVLSGRGSSTPSDTAQDTQDTQEEAKPEAPAAPDVTARHAPARPVTPANGLLGRVEIPRLNISAIVREGVDHKTLKHAVGHLPETALPGEPGNFAIAAHRDTFFRNLRGVRKGDRIHMVTPNGTFEYQVETTKIVWPTNVDVLKPTPDPSLTIVTCYPFNYIGSAPKRFVVRARQIVTEAKAEHSRTQKGS